MAEATSRGQGKENQTHQRSFARSTSWTARHGPNPGLLTQKRASAAWTMCQPSRWTKWSNMRLAAVAQSFSARFMDKTGYIYIYFHFSPLGSIHMGSAVLQGIEDSALIFDALLCRRLWFCMFLLWFYVWVIMIKCDGSSQWCHGSTSCWFLMVDKRVLSQGLVVMAVSHADLRGDSICSWSAVFIPKPRDLQKL